MLWKAIFTCRALTTDSDVLQTYVRQPACGLLDWLLRVAQDCAVPALVLNRKGEAITSLDGAVVDGSKRRLEEDAAALRILEHMPHVCRRLRELGGDPGQVVAVLLTITGNAVGTLAHAGN